MNSFCALLYSVFLVCSVIHTGSGAGEWFTKNSTGENIFLKHNEPHITSIHCGGNRTYEYTLNVADVELTTQYVLFQAHAQWSDVTLSESPTKQHDKSVTGSNVGLYQVMMRGIYNASCYLWCSSENEVKHITVLLFAQVPGNGAPMPGGCNMEFNLEDDPNLHIANNVNSQVDRVAFQYANKGAGGRAYPPKCESSARKKLSYTMYQYLLEDLSTSESDYFDHMKKILTWHNQKSFSAVLGRKVETVSYDAHTYRDFASYRAQGVIYSVMVRDSSQSSSNSRALYVPVHTYGCKNKANCTRFSSERIVSDVGLCMVGLLAIFVAFFGHRFFKTEMFLFGHLALMISILLVLVRFSTLSIYVGLIISSTLGIVGGIAWLVLWYYKGIPLVSILMPSFVMGFVFSSILFNFTPFGGLHIWANPISYGTAFTCGVLILPVALLYFTKLLNIVCCVLVGTFVFMWAVSVYLPGSFKHIVPNTLHSLTSSTYMQADTYSPFLINDIILCVLWVAIFFSALCFQIMREKGRPPFPPCPYKQRKRLARERELRPSPVNNTQIEDARGFSPDNTPLLGASNPRWYQATPPSRTSNGSYGAQPSPTAPPIEDNNRVVDPL